MTNQDKKAMKKINEDKNISIQIGTNDGTKKILVLPLEFDFAIAGIDIRTSAVIYDMQKVIKIRMARKNMDRNLALESFCNSVKDLEEKGTEYICPIFLEKCDRDFVEFGSENQINRIEEFA